MAATIIDGKASAAKLREKIAAYTAELKSKHGLQPGLATVLVGKDPASEVYVRNKRKTAEAIGFNSMHVELPESVSQAELLSHVKALSADPSVHGRSLLFGKPAAQLLLAANATVTMAHSRSRDLPGLARRADILVAAIGKPEFVKGDWIKPGATVIDVGINRVDAGEGKYKLVGDVDYEAVKEVAGAVPPVPRGVGGVHIVCFMDHTFNAALRPNRLRVP